MTRSKLKYSLVGHLLIILEGQRQIGIIIGSKQVHTLELSDMMEAAPMGIVCGMLRIILHMLVAKITIRIHQGAR